MGESENLLLLGDLNLPDIDWDTFTSSFSTFPAIVELAYNYSMYQLVCDSTHTIGNTLDVILTSCSYSNLPST